LLYKYIVPQMVAKYRFYNAYSGKMFLGPSQQDYWARISRR
jgi:hypothetical protein